MHAPAGPPWTGPQPVISLSVGYHRDIVLRDALATLGCALDLVNGR